MKTSPISAAFPLPTMRTARPSRAGPLPSRTGSRVTSSSSLASPDKQFVDAVAVAMITPGPVVITVAFIGYLVAGVAGATAAPLGIFLPVYLVVVLLAPSYKRWAKNPQLNAFVRGVTAAATGAIAGAVVVLARRSVYDLPTMLICAVSLAVLFRWKVPEPVLIACAAVVGLLLHHP